MLSAFLMRPGWLATLSRSAPFPTGCAIFQRRFLAALYGSTWSPCPAVLFGQYPNYFEYSLCDRRFP